MTGAARATVTSVSGLLEEAVALVVFAAVGLAGGRVGVTVLIAAGAVPMLLLAAALPRWLPPARTAPPASDHSGPPRPGAEAERRLPSTG
jgi:hypothetical protein